MYTLNKKKMDGKKIKNRKEGTIRNTHKKKRDSLKKSLFFFYFNNKRRTNFYDILREEIIIIIMGHTFYAYGIAL